MDIEEYSPIASLVVDKNKRKRSKYPFVDVHSHQWDMSYSNLKKLVSEMDSLKYGFHDKFKWFWFSYFCW